MQHRILAGIALAIGALATSTALAVVPAAASPAGGAPAAPSTAAATHQAPAATAYPLRCVVAGANVNYRRGPGTQYAAYGQLTRGFSFASSGELPNPRSRLQYWDNIERPGHADAWVDDAYVVCWLAR